MLQSKPLGEKISVSDRNAILWQNARDNDWCLECPEIRGTNIVGLIGVIANSFTYLYSYAGEKFYKAVVASTRKSGTVDYIPIIVSERLLDDEFLNNSFFRKVEISGEYRSRNEWDEKGKSHLALFVFVKSICEVVDEYVEENLVFLHGNICKKPIIRQTPFGRTITDFLIAVNRKNKKSDYIPCIAWGRTAKFLSECEVGDEIKLIGRMMSREYTKAISEDDYENRIAYEVSTVLVKLMPNNNRYQEEE